MFTPLQFSNLAATAWTGPAATIQASASTCLLAADTSAGINYSVCYTLAGVQYSTAAAYWDCPFRAIYSAIHAAAFAGVLSAEQYAAGCAVADAAAAAFANQPAPAGPATCARTAAAPPRRFILVTHSASAMLGPVSQIVCAHCGESEDHFGECRCSYVPVPMSRYFNV